MCIPTNRIPDVELNLHFYELQTLLSWNWTASPSATITSQTAQTPHEHRRQSSTQIQPCRRRSAYYSTSLTPSQKTVPKLDYLKCLSSFRGPPRPRQYNPSVRSNSATDTRWGDGARHRSTSRLIPASRWRHRQWRNVRAKPQATLSPLSGSTSTTPGG